MGHNSGGRAARGFIKDIEPFLYGRPITYVDVGAYAGGVLAELTESSINVRAAHLVEPNPANHELMRAQCAEMTSVADLAFHRVAISDSAGTLTMSDQGTMSHVITGDVQGDGAGRFDVTATTLDELARAGGVEHVDLLKVDVEGHELSVFAGAKDLLSEQRIDVIYVEAGVDPETTQQVYYRRIEDALNAYGYRLFRIYEQTHEWPTDSPLLRRVNLSFMSDSFASSHPFRLSRELARARKANEALETQVHELTQDVSSLKETKADLAGRLTDAEVVAARLPEAEQAARQAESERDAFVQYADELESRLRSVLRSSSWRLAGPLRVGLRAARRASGRQAGGRVRLPSRPVVGSIGPVQTADDVEAIAADVVELVKAADYRGLYRLKRSVEADMASDSGVLAYAFLMAAWARQTSTFAFGAQAADAAFRRYRRAELQKALGSRYYRRFVTDAAVALTRTGRYEEARDLLDREIDAGLDDLLPLRAEVSWIHDPEQAARDLAAHVERAGRRRAGEANLLLQRHLELNVLGRSEPGGTDGALEGEFRLVDAIKAAADGRHRDYRRLVNEYFADQGHAGPFDVVDRPFSFEDLVSPSVAPSSAGPLVSVIMTTFNSAATLTYAVESILRQTHGNIELLIVDDGSTDSTRELLESLAGSDSRIRLMFNERNIGTYAAKNRAMEIAEGSYLTFHDSDDWAHPERIQTHLDVMERDASVMATRSMWLRVEPEGRIDFRRWRKRFAHPYPASAFVRRAVVDRMGYFDTVRFGADSEYWYRAQRVFGRDAVVGLQDCLGLGRHDVDSLTRSGLGARNVEDYSAIRGAYQYSWFEWHVTAEEGDLRLEARPSLRKFWAPDGMAAPTAPGSGAHGSLAMCYPGLEHNADTGSFVFGISLASAKASKDWDVTQRLLGRTLRSVLNQSDGRWRAIVCGHERPALPELDDPRVMFVMSDQEPPKNSGQFRKDKMWKRRVIGSILRDLGGGYFFPLDADDLVHRDLVQHVLSDDNRRGYRVEHGYVEDLANERLAPVPGAWTAPFDRVCGSSAVLYFERDELPRNGQKDDELYFNLFQSHAYWPIVAEEWGRPLASVPFPGAVYVVNHSQNLSFGLQRSGDRTHNIIAAIERHMLDDGTNVLSQQFGQAV